MYVNSKYRGIIKNNLNKNYSDLDLYNRQTNPYVSMVVNTLIDNKNTKYCARYRDCMIYDYIDEFLKRFYSREETTGRLPGIAKYYKNYLKFMCKPTLRNLKVNNILHLYADQKAKIYHQIKYDKKGREKDNYKSLKRFETILTETIKEKINENVITKSQLDCEESSLNLEIPKITKENTSISLDGNSLVVYNENLSTLRSNMEESILFQLNRYEDRRVNEKIANKGNFTNLQKITNLDKTTKDNSVKDYTRNEIKSDKVVKEVVENDLKKKLKNIIQDINTKTRNRNNNNNPIATMSLLSKTNTQNKTNVIPQSLTSSKNNHTKFQKSYNNKSKFTTFQSKCSTNSSEPKKISTNAVNNVKMNKLDFRNFQTKHSNVIFKSHDGVREIKEIKKPNGIKEAKQLNRIGENKFGRQIKETFDFMKLQTKNKIIGQNLNVKANPSKEDKFPSKRSIPQQLQQFEVKTSDNLRNLHSLSLLTSRIEKCKEPKSRNIHPSIYQDNFQKEQYRTEVPKVKNTINLNQINVNTNPPNINNTKSIKINLNYPSDYESLRSRIYGSFEGNKFLSNIITNKDKKKISSPINIKNADKAYISKIIKPQIVLNNKKSDSTCDKSNQLTFNSIKGKEIISTITFNKNSKDNIPQKEKSSGLFSPVVSLNNKMEKILKFNSNSKNEHLTKNLNNKIKINLLNDFNSCSSGKQGKQTNIKYENLLKVSVNKKQVYDTKKGGK